MPAGTRLGSHPTPPVRLEKRYARWVKTRPSCDSRRIGTPRNSRRRQHDRPPAGDADVQPHVKVRQTRDALSVPELRRWKTPARLGLGARTLQPLQFQIRAQRRRRFDPRHVLQVFDRRVFVCLMLQRRSW